MMKLAIAHWQGRVSPVFDVARNLLIVNIDAEQALQRGSVALASKDPLDLARWVSGLDIDVLICGTISRPVEMVLLGAGVDVVPCICGDVEEVLAAFLDGRLQEGDAFLLPGCRGRRRACRGGRDPQHP